MSLLRVHVAAAIALTEKDHRPRFVHVNTGSWRTSTERPDRESYYEIHDDGVRLHPWNGPQNCFDKPIPWGGVTHKAAGDE